MKTVVTITLASLGLCCGYPLAAEAPKPTLANVAYGPHESQKLDFYQAKSGQPTPLVFFIHGGGWLNGDKAGFNNAGQYLPAGISVVSINYRLLPQAEADKVVPPVKGPLHDAARALQFVRTKAAEWNIDKERIGASGSSAGACSALWLAFHPDMADPQSDDPVARESTRLWCAAVTRAQTSLDPRQMIEWTPNNTYGPHAFGFRGDVAKKLTPFDEFLAKRDTITPWIAEYSPYALVSADDPPVYLFYDTPPAFGKPEKNPVHSANFGVGLAEKLKSLGIEHELVYPGATDVKHADVRQYLIEKLKEPSLRK
ncbi:alpha/beta hydrolase [Prosthecobacter sp.]|uniref:alpha/beta hydrolase n=1 Tax=Prosthecobacter sp. TaxID=1965333 RepID=UPI002ABB2FC6|nr:alpha/beta hydrolase [Prosthecobacter sp.]MDZ4403008.1 alpha/beta hydrolase [Prosthecobacter sp.]